MATLQEIGDLGTGPLWLKNGRSCLKHHQVNLPTLLMRGSLLLSPNEPNWKRIFFKILIFCLFFFLPVFFVVTWSPKGLLLGGFRGFCTFPELMALMYSNQGLLTMHQLPSIKSQFQYIYIYTHIYLYLYTIFFYTYILYTYIIPSHYIHIYMLCIYIYIYYIQLFFVGAGVLSIFFGVLVITIE